MQISNVQQECPHSCVVACIAMLANAHFSEVRECVSKPNLGHDETERLMVHFGLLPRRVLDNTLRPSNIYTAAVPSLDLPGSLHQIVIDTREDFEVYDPNTGRDGVKAYTAKTLKAWSDLLEVIDCRPASSPERKEQADG